MIQPLGVKAGRLFLLHTAPTDERIATQRSPHEKPTAGIPKLLVIFAMNKKASSLFVELAIAL